MKRLLVLAGIFALLVAPLMAGEAAKDEAKPQKTCPITSKAVDYKTSVEVKGFRIYVADEEAGKKVTADPDAAFKKLAELKEAAEPVSNICPFMKSEVNKKLFVDFEGHRIYLCCNMCIDLAKKDPAKAIKKIEEAATAPKKDK